MENVLGNGYRCKSCPVTVLFVSSKHLMCLEMVLQSCHPSPAYACLVGKLLCIPVMIPECLSDKGKG